MPGCNVNFVGFRLAAQGNGPFFSLSLRAVGGSPLYQDCTSVLVGSGGDNYTESIHLSYNEEGLFVHFPC